MNIVEKACECNVPVRAHAHLYEIIKRDNHTINKYRPMVYHAIYYNILLIVAHSVIHLSRRTNTYTVRFEHMLERNNMNLK